MGISPTQILIIALVVVLLFGASRIADIGKGLGEGIKNFKKGLNDEPGGEKPTDDDAKAAQIPSGKGETKETARTEEAAEKKA